MYRMLKSVVLLLFVFSMAAWAADDPVMGTWKANLAKSKYQPGSAPKSQVNKYEPYGDKGVKVTLDVVDAQGKRSVTQYSANYDGKDYPNIDAETGKEVGTTTSLRRINANTAERLVKRDGKIVNTQRRVVSKDGKVMTTTSNGTNAKGEKTSAVSVYDKQ